MPSIRILLADDHTLLRDAVAELLHMEDDLQVVAAAGDVSGAVALAAEHRPDVALLDIHMPGNEHPPTTLSRLRQAAPDMRVLVLSMYDDARLARELVGLGIRGYLHKSVTAGALVSAVREAATVNRTITLSLPPEKLSAVSARGPLSPREEQVIQLAAKGLSNHQIARALDITEGTVKRHMSNIFEKLGAQSRVEAANIAVSQGYIASPAAAFQAERPAARRGGWDAPAPGRRGAEAERGRATATRTARRTARSAYMPIPIPPPTGTTAPVT
ncbi:response regulator [Allonocardiopsis opalescens]|uniref:LuxR family two component transcriptional regulator n=1 Tax=Allonocardiopsis opalescens TaxID=1144618 RepID=A0A2T0PUI8_9ACTN|nr:response regulator transcription factor [Allonocardiopsis opalescens]PRX92567.1 LuxR family two component transcriptional regulator [Allonocardiopsis opalescens]